MPLTKQQRDALLSLGHNPDDYEPELNRPQSSSSPEESLSAPVVKTSGGKSTALGAGARSFGANALPTVAAGGAFAAGAAPVMPWAMGAAGPSYGLSLLAPLVTGGIASLLAGKGAAAAQKAYMPASWEEKLAQDAAEHPTATTVGSLATLPLGGMNPSAPNALKALGSLGKLPIGLRLAAPEAQNLMNVGVGAALNPIMEASTAGLLGEEQPDAKALAQSALVGALFNKPNRIGRAYGFHNPAEIARDSASVPNAPFEDLTPPTIDTRPRGTGDLYVRDIESRVPQAQDMHELINIAKKDVVAEAASGKLPLSPKTVHDLVRTGGDMPPIEKAGIVQSMKDRAKIEEGQKAYDAKVESERVAKLTNTDIEAQLSEAEQLANNTALPLTTRIAAQEQLNKIRQNVPPTKSPAEPLTKEVSKPIVSTEQILGVPKAMETIPAAVPKESSAGVPSKPQAVEPPITPKEQSAKEVVKFKVAEELNEEEVQSRLSALGAQHGVQVATDKSIGNDVAGVIFKNGALDTIARLHPDNSGIDTPHHEIMHALIEYMRNSKQSSLRRLIAKGEALFGGNEPFTQAAGKHAMERFRQDKGWRARWNEWKGDFSSFWKYRLGRATKEDIAKIMSYYEIHDTGTKTSIGGTRFTADSELPTSPKQQSFYQALSDDEKKEYGELHSKALVDRQNYEKMPPEKKGEDNLIESEVALKKFEDLRKQKSDKSEYDNLVAKFREAKSPEEKFAIQGEIEKVKNKHKGMVPKEQKSSDTTTPTKKERKPLTSFISPEIQKIQSHYGEQGKVVAKAFTDFNEKIRELRGSLVNPIIGDLRKHINFFNPKEAFTQNNAKLDRVRQYMDDVYDGKNSTITLTPEEKQIESDIRKSFLTSLAEKESRPKLSGTSADPKYFAAVPSRKAINTLLNKRNSPEGQQYIKDFLDHQTSNGSTPDEAQDMLRTFMAGYKNQHKNIAAQFGPIDKSANVPLPQSMRESNLIDRLSRFNDRYARRLAYHDTIESDPSVIAALEDPKTGIGTAEHVRNVLEDITGLKEHEEGKRNAAAGVVKAAMMGTATGLRDFASNVTLGFQHQDPLQAVTSPIKAWSNMRENIAESFKAGVNRYNIGSIEFGDGGLEDMTSVLRATRNILNSASGRNTLEVLSRATAYGQGKFLAMDNLQKLVRGSDNSQSKKFFKDFGEGVDLQSAIKTKEFTPQQVQKIASRYVESVQGTYTYSGLPQLTQHGSFAPVLSLARWNIEKYNNFVKYNIEPLRDGNFYPLLMSTVGMLIGGTAVTELNKLLTGRKDKAPTYEELAKALEDDTNPTSAITYKLAALSSMSGYAGIVGDLTKSLMDKQFHNIPQTYNNPLIEGIANAGELSWDMIEALQQGDLNSYSDILSEILERYFQTYRLALANFSDEKKADISDANAKRDLKMFKNLNDYPVADVSGDRPNPFLRSETKKFKKTEDLNEAVELLPTIIQKEFERSQGNFGMFKRRLEGLKQNSYPIMPNMDTDPEQFAKYVNYIRATQGDEAATELIVKYYKRNTINKAKSAMVPSL